MQPIIAVVNDDTAFLNLMDTILSDEGYRTIIWRQDDNAYEMIRRERPDLVILDIRMEHPEGGWHVVDLLRLDPETASIPLIICSADSAFLRDKAERLNELHCETLEKPFDLDDLLAKVSCFVGPPGKATGEGKPDGA
jgi:DNA-binding response OmpR family regulator